MKKQINVFSQYIDPKAMAQFYDAMKPDFSIKGALMPDAHLGYSLPIGGVVATDGVVVPSWVGYDIGCGMCALLTTFDIKDIKENGLNIFQDIYKHIPVGFNVNNSSVDCYLNPLDLSELGRKAFDERKGFLSIGSLGGGNHFIEIGEDETGEVWIIIHSGSRGVGHGIATEHMKLASGAEKPKEGHYGFDVKSDNGKAYINDLDWALEFALENRREIMKRVVGVIKDYCYGTGKWIDLINRNHNHAEEKDGLWIHRKGATHAEKGMMGVIPGNMCDGSFIVRGKGNPKSLWSSSHGAGRVLGRNQAKKTLDLTDFKSNMCNIVAKVENSTLDESPLAYKNIFEVMEQQQDLVDVVRYVKPIINIKG